MARSLNQGRLQLRSFSDNNRAPAGQALNLPVKTAEHDARPIEHDQARPGELYLWPVVLCRLKQLRRLKHIRQVPHPGQRHKPVGFVRVETYQPVRSGREAQEGITHGGEQEGSAFVVSALDEYNPARLRYHSFQPADDRLVAFQTWVVQRGENPAGRIKNLVALLFGNSFQELQNKLGDWPSLVVAPVLDCSFRHSRPFFQFRVRGR